MSRSREKRHGTKKNCKRSSKFNSIMFYDWDCVNELPALRPIRFVFNSVIQMKRIGKVVLKVGFYVEEI